MTDFMAWPVLYFLHCFGFAQGGLTFRGARGIFSARSPYRLQFPLPPWSEFKIPETRKIKKYQCVYHDVKNACMLK